MASVNDRMTTSSSPVIFYLSLKVQQNVFPQSEGSEEEQLTGDFLLKLGEIDV